MTIDMKSFLGDPEMKNKYALNKFACDSVPSLFPFAPISTAHFL